MISSDSLMQTTTIAGRLRDGGTCEIIVDSIKDQNLDLDGGLYHPYTRETGENILYILEDGSGNKFHSKNNNVGISLPGLIMGRKHMFGYKSTDVFDNRMCNLRTQKNRKQLGNV